MTLVMFMADFTHLTGYKGVIHENKHDDWDFASDPFKQLMADRWIITKRHIQFVVIVEILLPHEPFFFLWLNIMYHRMLFDILPKVEIMFLYSRLYRLISFLSNDSRNFLQPLKENIRMLSWKKIEILKCSALNRLIEKLVSPCIISVIPRVTSTFFSKMRFS